MFVTWRKLDKSSNKKIQLYKIIFILPFRDRKGNITKRKKNWEHVTQMNWNLALPHNHVKLQLPQTII